MSSSTNRTRTLTTLGILTAIILVMTFTPLGYIKTMGLEITLLHIPVILGAALTGPTGGMVLGAVFGFTSFFQCFGLSTFGTTLFSINPAGTFIVCVIPRVLLLRSPHRQVERHHHRCTGHHLPYGNVHGHAGDLLLHQ